MNDPTTTWLYRFTSEAGNKSSYLFGTMHLVCTGRYRWPSALDEVINEVNVLYLETDLTHGEEFFSNSNFRFSNTAWSEDLSESQKSALRSFNQSHWYLTEEQLWATHPFYLLAQLQADLLDCPTMALDQELMHRVMAMNKSIRGLESLDEHLQVIDRVDMSEYVQQLLYCIEHYNDVRQAMLTLSDHYHSGNSTEIEKLLKKWAWILLPSETDKAFLYERNQLWIPIIERAMEEDSTLFAIGAAHLLSEQGLLSLLRKRGYQILMI